MERRRFLSRSIKAIAGSLAFERLALGQRAAEAATRTASGPNRSPSATEAPRGPVDVAIVGGGFAGIEAARRLTEAGKKVVLLEARDRLGGRTKTETFPGGVTLDVGGQWIGPTQDRALALVQRFGVETFRTYDEGKSILIDGGKSSQYEGTIPTLDVLSLLDLDAAMKKLMALSRTVDLDSPWETPDALELDSMTIATWLDRQVWSRPARRLLAGGMRQLFAAEPARVSLLHALFFIRAAGSLDILLGVIGGAQQDRFTHGTASLVEKMVEPFRSQIHLSCPVRSIEQGAQGVRVRTDRFTVQAGRVIVAVPPALASRISYSPLLSADRDQLTQTMPMGSVAKCMAFYPKPFWRERGLKGQAVSTEGLVFATFDNSPPSGTPGVLLGFSIGAQSEQLRRIPAEERRKAVLNEYARFFGPEALNPIHYLDHSWAEEEWSRGCYLGFFPPGIWTTLGPALRRPEGRIHWAGTETARVWTGYIEGALESGERAAQEALG